MLNPEAWKCVQFVMRVGCFVKFVPYQWSSKKRRLVEAPKWHMIIFYFHYALACFMGIFIWVRFLRVFAQELKAATVPYPVIAGTCLWAIAYVLQIFCFVQFSLKKDQIRNYANILFAHIEDCLSFSGLAKIAALKAQGGRKASKPDIKQKQYSNWVSNCIKLNAFILIVNPPSHSWMLVNTPCSPQFLSSAVFPCETTIDDTEPFINKIPFIFMENMTITNLFYLWTFNWTLIFLGLAWIKRELDNLATNDKSRILILSKYRTLHFISNLINESFPFFLQWFPSTMVGIVAFLIFASIRFWYLPIGAYFMFPTCAVRCGFESFSLIAIAGQVNRQSYKLLKDWKHEKVVNGSGTNNMMVKKKRIYTIHNTEGIAQFQRSCHEIRCAAGAFFVFNNRIVLSTISICTQSTCNLLVMFKN